MSELSMFNWFQVAWAFLIVIPFASWWGFYAANNGHGPLSFFGLLLPAVTALSFLPVAAWYLFQH